MSSPANRIRKPSRRAVLLLAVLVVFFVPLIVRATLFALGDAPRSWRDADWSSTGILPPASSDKAARVIVFAGTAGAWKGVFAVHSWIVLKRENASRWTRYDVVGWGHPVRTNNWPVDGRWYGNMPHILVDVSGPKAERIIPKVEAAVHHYRFAQAGDYSIWPGPNSNSFIAALLRAVPELGLTLPSNAIGRDYRPGFYAGLTDSRTGVEFNVSGVASVKLGWVEGLEINLLGLVAGLDIRNPGLKLPGFGRIGISDTTAFAR